MSSRIDASGRLLRRILTATLVAGALVACGSSDDEAAPAKDAPTSCQDLCTSSGFTSGKADVYPHETNCSCTGGTGTVTAGACTSMCTGLGKTKAQQYKSGMVATENACQCS